MKKRFIALILVVITVLGCCAFTSIEDTELQMIEQENNTCIRIERIDKFTDNNLKNYNVNQLTSLIEEQKDIQKEAHKLAESARKLGWAEESDPIYSAGSEWCNAQLAIETYTARYEELSQKIENSKWNSKKAEYPVATEIWLYMKDLGWNDYVCAGIMGNLMTEVGGQTLNIQYWLKGNGYYGMCQWNKSYNKVWNTNLKTQCDFLRDTIKNELDTFGYAYQKGFNFNSFLNLSNEKDAAKAFAKCYERCSSGSYSIRQNNAIKAYDYFVNN